VTPGLGRGADLRAASAPLDRQLVGERLARFSAVTGQVGGDEGSAAAAVAITIVRRRRELGIWMTRRAYTLRSHPGQFALPGGRIDPGEDAPGAARRELSEELGIEVEADRVLGRLDDYRTRSGFVMSPVVLWAADTFVEPVPSPAEVAEVFFWPLSGIDVDPEFESHPETDRPVIRLPWHDGYLHAPTAAVIHQFREVVLHDRHTRIDGYDQPPFAWR